MAFAMLLVSVLVSAVGWTPTDGGLVVDLEQGDRFLLSVMVDHDNNPATPDREYFVANYTRYAGDDYFHYTFKDGNDGHWLKLLQQAANATEPSEVTIWTTGAPLSRVIGEKDYSLGGIVYTIWNDGKTLRTNNTNYQFIGDLTSDYGYKDACDVVFIIPTDQASRTSFDPSKTLRSVYNRTDQNSETGKINGKIGKGFLGMTYREVYMMDIPRQNNPISYTNAALVTFNTTTTQKSWSNGQIICDPGHAAYAYADTKHHATHRTLFRLYLLDKPFNYCNSYYFATDEQDVKQYRKENEPKSASDWTTAKKIYTIDWMTPMKREGSSRLYKTDYMSVPVPDSTYFYVGYKNDYKASTNPSDKMGNPGAFSQFEKIRTLPLEDLPTLKAPAGAYGKMVVDTTSTDNNLGVKFEPAGYMLRTSSGKNVRMKKTGDNVWTTLDMWTIDKSWVGLTIKATLMTTAEFSETDPGADVEGWSVDVEGKDVRVQGHADWTPAGRSGYARITTNSSEANGNMVFIVANTSKHIHYDNNGFLGTEIPNQYPLEGAPTLAVAEHRLKAGYTFLGWNTQADGKGTMYQPNDVITLTSVTWIGDTVFNLYAQATYDGTLQAAISFIGDDDKRYFLTHPNSSTPRYARARHFDNWDNTWQGMENAENLDPNYVSTFEMRHPSNEIHKKEKIGDEYIADLSSYENVLDPSHYTMKGYVDSLTFYEYFTPADDEYLGLYYQDPNTILANNTWAGLFSLTTADGSAAVNWPNYQTPYVPDVKLKSERYVQEYDPANKPDSLILKVRSNSNVPYVKYDATHNQFDGTDDVSKATTFYISAVSVADAHYIILPDTSEAWHDEITFGYHQDKQTREAVWSKLIGKQLMAVMRLGNDTVYFHPNRNKIINDPNNLYLSPEFRITQNFDFIPDASVTSVADEDRVTYEATSNYWHYDILSGNSSPMNVKNAKGDYIDIVDTFRITLSQGGISKVKEYRGRWKKQGEDDGLTVDGLSRYRDVIIRTKTYHYTDTITHLVLKPEYESYNFGPLTGQTRKINFILLNARTHKLRDAENNVIQEEIIGTPDTITSKLQMMPGQCRLWKTVNPSFEVVSASTGADSVTLRVIDENISGINYDTLYISKIKVDGVETSVDVRVPLVQAALEGDELIWSVENSGQRYYIVAGTGGLQYRKFRKSGSTLYKEGTSIHLKTGSANPANDDNQYITPWTFDYTDKANNELTLQTKYDVNKYFAFSGAAPGTPGVGASGSNLKFEFVNVYTNANANYEEQVKLKYNSEGSWYWLKFTVDETPALSLTDKEAEASVFSWSYLRPEYYLLNNGQYPSRDYVEFGYNSTAASTVQTRYKAYRDSSMLVGNTLTYLCREDENDINDLIDADGIWRTFYEIDTLCDRRTATPSGFSHTTNTTTLTTTITPSGDSPTGLMDIVDTLRVRLSLQTGAPNYHFVGDWSSYKAISDANLKIPLVRKAYHSATYDSLLCVVEKERRTHTFPASLGASDSVFTFVLKTEHHTGTHVLDVNNNTVAVTATNVGDSTNAMDLTNNDMAEVRLVDEYGNTPTWCRLQSKTKNTITVKCLQSGIRAPRSANLYLAYIVYVTKDAKRQMRFVNARLTVSQLSLFDYDYNQVLVPSGGASGDPLVDGRQQVHQNRRILYYYPDEDIELPVRERAFYGWWRWYDYSTDADIPSADWRVAPTNTGKFNFPYRIIGDTVEKAGVKTLVTQGRYTVFHYRSKDYATKVDPPAKSPRVAPPDLDFAGVHPTNIYAVDISNYYDNLPLSVSRKNQVDTAMMDTMHRIIEPTLSLREIFEVRPWTQMADTLQRYKSTRTTDDAAAYPLASERYMEDHVVIAPLGNPLLLSTEQRYNKANLLNNGHSESLLGYYMRDDHNDDLGWTAERKDSMVWCGGWDQDCQWYTYDPTTETYAPCEYDITPENDFLKVPAKNDITAGQETETVYYCLRSRSRSTTGTPGTEEEKTAEGNYMFNICRYKIIYHRAQEYGPKLEEKGKAIITNDEIAQHYEVLERLNFDYNKPGSDYTIYPHPLPWADASYGFTYPETPSLPHNRYHDESDFPNGGEYGLVNRIPYSTYWKKMEQHGGAANGYMIYCDGMSAAGQVAALSLSTNLCQGQRMYFSGYVGNPSSQTGKSNPSFTFSVQGSNDKVKWEDITSFMTGDILPSDKWYQIFFPISTEKSFKHFRVRIYNMASSFDGNDFIIDDMCIFATKPQLIAYQANTRCMEQGGLNDSLTHVIVRVDYQGFEESSNFNGKDMYYTVEQKANKDAVSCTYVKMDDHYLNETTKAGASVKFDTIYGSIRMPAKDYEPSDSIYANIYDLISQFESSNHVKKVGYIYENIEDVARPVLYVIHQAKMAPENYYVVRMAQSFKDMLSSICSMTSELKISNRMVLELNGEEQPRKILTGMCANMTYDLSLRVKGALYLDSVAPIDVNGSCVNDWLLYGDTVDDTSKERYGYYYSDIAKVITHVLRVAPESGTNENQFIRNLSEINKNALNRYSAGMTFKQDKLSPYTLISDLVNNGFLTLYKSNITASVLAGDSVRYVIFPIVGTGTDAMNDAKVEVCPAPVFIKLNPEADKPIVLSFGGVRRDSTQSTLPLTLLADELTVNEQVGLLIDSIAENIVIDSVYLFTTDDPNFREGIDVLHLMPDKSYNFAGDNPDYYENGDIMRVSPALHNTYRMQPGYKYTFLTSLKTNLGRDTLTGGCRVGTIPFTISVVPNFLRWDPKSDDSRWNNPENWLGITQSNEVLHNDAHFVPLSTSNVIIPAMNPGVPYPNMNAVDAGDSIQQVGAEYNSCGVVRFLPGAAMRNQQNLHYTDVVVDMAMPNQKWAMRAAPVEGMLSGDIFMADADIDNTSSPWEIGEFDASGRNYTTGNASFWMSLYSREVINYGNGAAQDTLSANAQWSKVTNAIKMPLMPAQGFAVYTRTASGKEAVVRLPKNDDTYYYFNVYGEPMYDHYENGLRALRNSAELANGNAGKFAFRPDGDSVEYTLKNEASSTIFVFGNPTMGYIDIWGFIADNPSLNAEVGYLEERSGNDASRYISVTRESALATTDTITNLARYLPPMHVMVLKVASAATSLDVNLYANRIVTHHRQATRPLVANAPQRANRSGIKKGIMTVTAINPVSTRCNSRLLLGQGYHAAILEGEDALLTTLNIDNYTNNTTPSTPFNIYAVENNSGLSIDLRDEIQNVPLSFLMSDLPFNAVTQLWFSGVNNIDGELVLFDSYTGIERRIIDGIHLDIATPEQNHEVRYYIRRRGFDPNNPSTPVATAIPTNELDDIPVTKIIRDGQVLIIRDGHIYTPLGQKLR